MKPLSPVEAVSPSFLRTRSVLLPPGLMPGQNAPFRLGFFFKIVIVAAFTQTSFYAATLSVCVQSIFFATSIAQTGVVSRLGKHSATAPHGLVALLLPAAIAGGLIGLALWILLGWLWCRLRFTLFDLVVFRHGRVGVAWSRYASPAWRFLGIAVLATLLFLMALAVTAGPLLFHFILTVRHLTPQQINSNPALIFAHIVPMYGVVLLLFIAVSLVDALMQDFLLPPMAIENAPVESAGSRFLRLLKTRPGPVIVYLLLRFALQIGLGAAATMALFIVLGILGFAGVAIGFFLYHAFFHASVAGSAVFILYCVIAGLLFMAFYFAAIFSIQGALAVFRQCYAVCFYGSHYPQLGDFLEPPPDALVSAPSPVPPAPPVMPPVQEPPPVW